MRTRTALLVLSALAAAGLAACGDDTKEVKAAEVSQLVQAQILTPSGISATVTCPPKTKAKKDVMIRCTIADSESNKGSATVTVLDKKGKLGPPEGDVVDIQRAAVIKNATENARSKGVSRVKCPGTAEPRAGAIYFCRGFVKKSGPAVVLVKQKNEKGEVSVKVTKRKISTSKIKRQIAALYKRKAKINVKVSCPAKVKSNVGSHFTCTVSNRANGKSQQILATQTNTKSTFKLKIK